MSTETSPQTAEIPAEEETTVGALLNERYVVAKARLEAHDQNAWVDDIHLAHPEAAFAHVNIECDDDLVRCTAGIDLYTADGSPIALDMQVEADLEFSFGTGWDMSKHETADTAALFNSDAEVFSLRSIRDAWAAVQSSTDPETDPFAHLTGMAKARAQGDYGRKLSIEAAGAYVADITAKLRTAHPDAARVCFTRKVDLESGLTFDMEVVQDADGNAVAVDLSAIEDSTFQDKYLDDLLDYDEDAGELYIDLADAQEPVR